MRSTPKLAMLLASITLAACSGDAVTSVPTGGTVLLSIVSGNNQQALPGEELPAPLVVVATDAGGRVLRGELVNFHVVGGGGEMFAGSSITDKQGRAQDWWTLGLSGTQTVEVRSVDPTTGQKHTHAVFTATFADMDADGDGYLGSVDCNDANPTVHPGATDLPDAAFVDSNCDGLDGDKSTAVFVTPSGADNPECGTFAAPCQTIAVAMFNAAMSERSAVFIGMGDYVESVLVRDGVSLYGGYSSDFSTRSLANRATITGDDEISGHPFTVFADAITLPTTLAGLIVRGTNAPVAKSSHAVFVRGGTPGVFTISQTRIIAGNGGVGTNGANGGSALATAAASGGTGQAGNSVLSACDNSSRGAGGGGASGVSNGGGGGFGGTADTDCDFFSLNFDARPGSSGGFGSGSSGGFGAGGSGGNPCSAGGNGTDGRTTNGTNGGAGSGFAIVSGFYAGNSGTAGGLGANGTGGGGGGGSGGCDDGTDSWGSGGGGGGAGGVRAPTAGTGGNGAGASVGIFIVNATPILSGVEIQRGNGGNGGAGGNGGQGQPGGVGGNGGPAVDDTRAGGRGGKGGDGGDSGAGGGGAGGASIGILVTGGGSVNDGAPGAVTYSGGSGGSGGVGGIQSGVPAPHGAGGALAGKITA